MEIANGLKRLTRFTRLATKIIEAPEDVDDLPVTIQGEARCLLGYLRGMAELLDTSLTSYFDDDGYRFDWGRARNAAFRMKGQLEWSRDEGYVTISDDRTFAVDALHIWVRESCGSLLRDGYRREAIQAAATQVELHLRAKVKSPLSGTKLIQAAFSLDEPASDRKRLRLPGIQANTETYRNIHQGALQFGVGCFMAIRNTSSHELQQPKETLALEQLSALSLLARWIDRARVVSATNELDDAQGWEAEDGPEGRPQAVVGDAGA